MSDTTAPLNSNSRKRSDPELIDSFLNYFLVFETFQEIPIPLNLDHDYDDMDENTQKAWQEYVFTAVNERAKQECMTILKRHLKEWERNLIKHRVIVFFKKFEINPEQD